jgi:hypothetical protein
VTSDLAVVSGIPAGTTVVLEGGQNLRPGMPIARRRAGNAS